MVVMFTLSNIIYVRWTHLNWVHGIQTIKAALVHTNDYAHELGGRIWT